mmetsp:Transcript_41392/g.95891  ORF Transcript_41392/g.95891 Transcript_41392/m.95891 type:complete len:170 (+) Transcript_41392:336-845(+)
MALTPVMATSFWVFRAKHPRASLRQWLGQSMQSPTAWASRLFFYNITAHFLKDFMQGLEPMLVAHHVFCIAILFLQAYVIVDGANSCLAGCAAFELGSAAYNLIKLYPGCESFVTIYVVVMTISNVLAVWCYWEWVKLPDHPKSVDVFATMVTLTLAIMRQKVALETYL